GLGLFVFGRVRTWTGERRLTKSPPFPGRRKGWATKAVNRASTSSEFSGESGRQLRADGLGGGVAAAEIIAGFAQVGGDLRAKLGGPAEFSFISQSFPEAHLEPSLV